MYIQVVLSILYVGHVFHSYLNALYIGKKNEWPIITNEEYINQSLEYNEIFFNEYDMEKISEEERKNVTSLGIPKKFFENKEKKCGSRTKLFMDLLTQRDLEFEKFVENFICEINETSDKDIKGFIVFGEAYESIRYMAQKYKFELINYEFSTFRKSNGFPMSLMYANTKGQLYESFECQKRYQNFIGECKDINFFSRKELLALFGKSETLHLQPLLNNGGYRYELGVCGMGGKVYPHAFCREAYTDEDIYYKCSKIYDSDEWTIREHPGYLRDECQLLAKRDPMDFILSCKRIAAVTSNVLLEAMLWNRVACTECNIVAFSFACEKDFKSEKIIKDIFLNFFIIAYLVPKQETLFSPDYWEWRRKNTSEREIFLKHINIILAEYGLDNSILMLNEEERYEKILMARGISKCEIEMFNRPINDSEINFDMLSSYIELKNEAVGIKKKLYCLNRNKDNEIVSEFIFENNNFSEMEFFPIGNAVGIIKINKIFINQKEFDSGDNDYYIVGREWGKKIEGIIEYKKNHVVIKWQYRKWDVFSLVNEIQNEMKVYKERENAMQRELDSIYNSKLWVATKPLRQILDLFIAEK